MSFCIKTLAISIYSRLKDCKREEYVPLQEERERGARKRTNQSSEKTHDLAVGKLQQERAATATLLDPHPTVSGSLFKTSRFPRSFPPLGIHDTVIAIGDQIVSVHGSGIFFEDQEIVKVSAVVAKETTDSWLTICFSESGKAIVQQQSIRGCTAAAAAMLFLNYGKRPDYQKLRRCNLGTFKTQEEEAKLLGLKPERVFIPKEAPMPLLFHLCKQAGSVLVAVDDPIIGGHCVVVDEIADNLSWVRLRDPYHALEMTVKGQAFRERFKGGEALHIVSDG